MVAGTTRLNGDESVNIAFNVSKVHIEDSKDEYMVELPESWARVLAEELSAVLIRSGHLYRLYRQGQLAPHVIHSDQSDVALIKYEHNIICFSEPVDSATIRVRNADIQTETFVLYHHRNLTKIGSISAFGSTEGSGIIQIRFWKAAIRRILTDRHSLNIEISKPFGEDVCLCVRKAEVELRQLRSLKRLGSLSDAS